MEGDQCLGLLEGHTCPIRYASLNNIGKAAVTVGVGDENGVRSLKIWSLETMQCTANLTATSEDSAARLLKDRLLVGSNDGPIKVWDIGGADGS